MGRQVVNDTQAGFSSGVNTVSDPAFLRPDQARQMVNYRLSNYGSALKRMGTAITNLYTNSGGIPASSLTTFDTTNSVYSGFYWPTKSTIYVVGAASGSRANNIWKTSYPSSGTFPVTWTSVGAVGIQWRPTIFTDATQEITYYAGDPTAAVQKFDGTSVSSLTTSTAQVIGLCVFNDRLWGWNGGTGKENYLYYSNLSTAVGSTGGDSLGLISAGGGFIIIRTFGMSSIRACAALGGSLLIVHERGISRLTGFGQDDTTVTPQALTSDVGMANGTPSGICEYGGRLYFVTDRGIYWCTENTVGPIGTPDKPDPTIPLLQNGSTDPSRFILRFNRQFNELWVFVGLDPGASLYTYNVILQAWAGPFDQPYNGGMSVSSITGPRDFFEVTQPAALGGNSKMWFVAWNDNAFGLEIFETDHGNQDFVGGNGLLPLRNQPIVGVLQFHRMFAGDRVQAKSWRWVNVLASLSQVTVPTTAVIATQSGTTTQNVGVAPYSGTEQPYYVQAGCGFGPWLDVTITDPSVGTPSVALATIEGNVLGQR